MTSRKFYDDLVVDLALAENALRDIAGMVHQEHLTARVNGSLGEATLNRIDHAITRIVMEALEGSFEGLTSPRHG